MSATPIFKLVDELPENNLTTKMLHALDFVAPGQWRNLVGFEKTIEVISVPADSPTVAVERYRLPPRAVLLTCTKDLVVWSHKKGNAPPVQRMDATGNAYLRSDDYDGWGEVISNDGKLIVLTGSEAIPARIMERFNAGNEQAGKKIIYDRGTGSYKVIDSSGGTLGGGSPKK